MNFARKNHPYWTFGDFWNISLTNVIDYFFQVSILLHLCHPELQMTKIEFNELKKFLKTKLYHCFLFPLTFKLKDFEKLKWLI